MLITRGLGVDIIEIIYVPITDPISYSKIVGGTTIISSTNKPSTKPVNTKLILPDVNSSEVLVDAETKIYNPIITTK